MARQAIVTGGSGGIGLACARRLVERGYQVLLTSRRREPLRDAADTIGAQWVAADCSDAEDVDRIVGSVGQVDLLVHAAGILVGGGIRDEPLDTFDEIVRVNLRSTFLITKAVVSRMGPGGRIIYISSTAGLKGQPGLIGYSASKAGMTALAQAVAGELEGEGINVHILVPAPVDTPILSNATMPMHTLLVEDVADAVGWLDSLDPRIVVRELIMRSVVRGPFAPEKIVPQGVGLDQSPPR